MLCAPHDYILMTVKYCNLEINHGIDVKFFFSNHTEFGFFLLLALSPLAHLGNKLKTIIIYIPRIINT